MELNSRQPGEYLNALFIDPVSLIVIQWFQVLLQREGVGSGSLVMGRKKPAFFPNL
jgi:hypothetical protein